MEGLGYHLSDLWPSGSSASAARALELEGCRLQGFRGAYWAQVSNYLDPKGM